MVNAVLELVGLFSNSPSAWLPFEIPCDDVLTWGHQTIAVVQEEVPHPCVRLSLRVLVGGHDGLQGNIHLRQENKYISKFVLVFWMDQMSIH